MKLLSFAMQLERLIALAEQRPRFPLHRVTYAQVQASCSVAEGEALDLLARIQAGVMNAAETRTALRRLCRALPQAGLHCGRKPWSGTPRQVWRWALGTERQCRMMRLTRQEVIDAITLVQAGGRSEWRLDQRLSWCFSEGGRPARFVLQFDGDVDPEEVADGMLDLHARYLSRVQAPEMDEDELVDLLDRWRTTLDDDWVMWRDEHLLSVLDQQLPNAAPSETLFGSMTFCRSVAMPGRAFIREALARKRPDPDIYVIYD